MKPNRTTAQNLKLTDEVHAFRVRLSEAGFTRLDVIDAACAILGTMLVSAPPELRSRLEATIQTRLETTFDKMRDIATQQDTDELTKAENQNDYTIQ